MAKTDGRNESLIADVKKNGKTAQGKNEYIAYLEGKRISYKERCLAQCYYCMGFYADGKVSCGETRCPLFTIMPYKTDGGGWLKNM